MAYNDPKWVSVSKLLKPINVITRVGIANWSNHGGLC